MKNSVTVLQFDFVFLLPESQDGTTRNHNTYQVAFYARQMQVNNHIFLLKHIKTMYNLHHIPVQKNLHHTLFPSYSFREDVDKLWHSRFLVHHVQTRSLSIILTNLQPCTLRRIPVRIHDSRWTSANKPTTTLPPSAKLCELAVSTSLVTTLKTICNYSYRINCSKLTQST